MIDKTQNPAEIYLVPVFDGDHDHVWCDTPAPGEGMREEDATRYVREDLVPASNEVLARRIVELTNERDAAWRELREIREAVCANPEKSTADEVREMVWQKRNICQSMVHFQKNQDHWYQEAEKLKAQVEELREVLRYADNKLYILTHNRKDVSPRLLTDADKGYKAVHEAVLGFKDNLNVLVAGRDAEIKAQAVEDAANELASMISAPPGIYSGAVIKLNLIAKKIRQQAKGK